MCCLPSMLFISASSSSSSSSMLLTSLQYVSMVMQQGSEVTEDGLVEEVGRQVVCEGDNILQRDAGSFSPQEVM